MRGGNTVPLCVPWGVGWGERIEHAHTEVPAPVPRAQSGGLGVSRLSGIAARDCPPTDGGLLGSGPSVTVCRQARLLLQEPKGRQPWCITWQSGESEQRSRGAVCSHTQNMTWSLFSSNL